MSAQSQYVHCLLHTCSVITNTLTSQRIKHALSPVTTYRSKAALRLKFEVCKELRGHIELLPETGYIQAQSTYSVQLKFLPR
jgi:hypothetical protein